MTNKENNNVVLAVVIALLVLLALGGFGMMGFGGMGGMMGGFYGGFGMPIFGWIIMILVAITLILFILWLVKQLNGGKDGKRN